MGGRVISASPICVGEKAGCGRGAESVRVRRGPHGGKGVWAACAARATQARHAGGSSGTHVASLLLPAREALNELAPDHGVAAALQLQQRDHLLHAIVLLGAAERGQLELDRVIQHLHDGELLDQVIELLDVSAHVLQVLLLDDGASESDGPTDGAGRLTPSEDIHQAGLAAPRGTKERTHPAWQEATVETGENDLVLFLDLDRVADVGEGDRHLQLKLLALERLSQLHILGCGIRHRAWLRVPLTRSRKVLCSPVAVLVRG